MTEIEFYDLIGGDYSETIKRLMRDSLVRKFVLKFKDDTTFSVLKNALSNDDMSAAFSAAHTLKGVALNLAFKKLSENAIVLTDMLRPANINSHSHEEIMNAFTYVESEYNNVLEAIKKLEE